MYQIRTFVCMHVQLVKGFCGVSFQLLLKVSKSNKYPSNLPGDIIRHLGMDCSRFISVTNRSSNKSVPRSECFFFYRFTYPHTCVLLVAALQANTNLYVTRRHYHYTDTGLIFFSKRSLLQPSFVFFLQGFGRNILCIIRRYLI